MKNIFESPEVFTAYATINAGYYMIKLAQEEFDKKRPRSAIEKMIDINTGAGIGELQKHYAYVAMCMEDIINAKIILEEDVTKDREIFEKLKSNLKSICS